MAIDIIGIINHHANAARRDASIVDKLQPSSLMPVESLADLKADDLGSLL